MSSTHAVDVEDLVANLRSAGFDVEQSPWNTGVYSVSTTQFGERLDWTLVPESDPSSYGRTTKLIADLARLVIVGHAASQVLGTLGRDPS